MQGNAYWPTAKGQSIDLADGLKVTLEDVICNVHWSERHLTVSSGKNVSRVKHYQINVYPAKYVSKLIRQKDGTNVCINRI